MVIFRQLILLWMKLAPVWKKTGSVHGTAVAEAVCCDMAPGIQLYLIKIDDDVDLENAKDYCKAEGTRHN